MTIVKKTIKDARPMTREELEIFDSIRDEDIDFSEIPETDKEFWKDAKIVYPKVKEVSITLDTEVLEWYQSHGKRHKELMQAILRIYMEAQVTKQKLSETEGNETTEKLIQTLVQAAANFFAQPQSK